MKLVAIMIVRNEEACLPRCLEHLREQGLTAAVLDNDSTDRTRQILAAFPDVVTRVDHAPFDGTFRWQVLLNRAETMQREIDADWLHLNSPDEMMNSDRSGERLVDAVARIASQGYNTINYDEFVFLPTDERTNGAGKAFDRLIRHYYFYGPHKQNQMRTWRKAEDFSNILSGGHRLVGRGLRIYPQSLPLRHYIALSAERFRQKYRQRRYLPEEVAQGWHADRVAIDTEGVRMPAPGLLKYFAAGDPSTLDRSEVWIRHFWESVRPARIEGVAAAALSKALEPAGPKPGSSLDVVGRNEACPCGSGRKYKHCHGRRVRDLGLRSPAAGGR